MKESSYLEGRDELLPRMFELPSLAGFKEDHLRKIMRLSKVRSYDPGETIISQGQFDCWFYVLISGAVKVVRDGKDIGLLQKTGDLFGEMGVIRGDARSASIVAAKPVTCLAIDGSVFERQSGEDQMALYALLYKMFSEVLSARLDAADKELAEVKEELRRLKGA